MFCGTLPRMFTEDIQGFLVRIFASALAPFGAAWLLLGLAGVAEAEIRTGFAPAQIAVTVHAEARVVHEPDTRDPPPSFGEIVMAKFDMTTIYNALVACMGEEGKTLDEDLNCVSPSDPPPAEFLDGGAGEYPADLCARLGGDVKLVSGQGVCQNIDTDGTFCFMGAPEVFPCRGLYKRVTHCNHFNRPGKNPFSCGRGCPEEEGEEQFACGSKCWSGEIHPTGRIPYVVPRYNVSWTAMLAMFFGWRRLCGRARRGSPCRPPFSRSARRTGRWRRWEFPPPWPRGPNMRRLCGRTSPATDC